MQTQAILNANYLDIVFDNRNKRYGGYELRTHYQRRMKAAITAVIAACSIIAIAASVKKQQHINPPAAAYREIEITRIEPPTMVKPVVTPPPPAASVPKTNTVKLTPPIIKPDDMVKPDDLPADVKQLQNATTGNSTHIGLPGNIDGPLADTKPNTNVVATPTDTKPFTFVEQMPEFMGNLNEYLGKALTYPAVARDNNVQGKVIVQFVVNEDGSVSNAKILRGIGSGCDAEALRVVSGMPKWKAGKQNGKAVKVYYTLPIRFELG